MPIQLNEENDAKILIVHVSDKLLRADYEHFGDIERIAMVGEKQWQEGVAIFFKPFTKAGVRYFESAPMSQMRESGWMDPLYRGHENNGTHSELTISAAWQRYQTRIGNGKGIQCRRKLCQ